MSFLRSHNMSSLILFFKIDSNIRIVTLTLTIRLLRKLIYNDETKTSYLSFEHMKRVEHSYQRARHDLERYFKVRR